MPPAGRLPNLFILGAPRCGTAALYNKLAEHPQIYAPQTKEPHFFARDLRAPGFFSDRDAYASLYARAGDASCIVDGSVWSLYSKVAARLIREAVPDARAIVMLRDPVELMRSLHARNYAFGDEDIADFASAWAAQADRSAGRGLPMAVPFPEAVQYTRVAQLGEQVSRLLESFPREDVHFVVLEDLAADPFRELAAVLHFLGVDPWIPDSFERFNENRRRGSGVATRVLYQDRWSVRAISRRLLSPRVRMVVRSTGPWRRIARANAPVAEREDLDPHLRDRLRDLMREDVASLGSILRRDLRSLWWTTGKR